MTKKTLCFVAGKSGGHIIPCLTIAQHYCQNHPDTKVLFFSANTSLDKHVLNNHPIVSWHIPLPLFSIQVRSITDYVTIPLRTVISFIMSFFYLLKYKPTEIITTGGVVALPTCYAGFILRIPIIIYCLDAVPGKAIKALQPIATTINTCFSNSQKYFTSAHVVPYPVKYTQHDLLLTQEQAINSLHLDNNKKTVVILGGSQGSLFLNDITKQWATAKSFPRDAIQIIHQTGAADSRDWNSFYKQHNIAAHVFSYTPNLAAIYAAADLIICRAGAGTLFEIQFFNKQCLIIPLKTNTTTHQVDNARAISNQYPHLFEWIDQNTIEKNPNILFARIHELLNMKTINLLLKQKINIDR